MELLADTELGGGIVEGVLVVPVVPSLTNGADGHEEVLSGPDVLIVGLATIEVCQAVHAPGEVKDNAVTEGTGAFQEHLNPEVLGDQGREHKSHELGEPGVKAVLEHHYRVSYEVAVVQRLARDLPAFTTL